MAEKKNPGTRRQAAKLNIANENVFEAIRQRAYELYCQRGHTNGDDWKDWLEAEKQIKHEMRTPR